MGLIPRQAQNFVPILLQQKAIYPDVFLNMIKLMFVDIVPKRYIALGRPILIIHLLKLV